MTARPSWRLFRGADMRRAPVLLLVIAGLLLAACGSDDDGAAAEQTFVFGTSASPALLDGAQVRDIEAARVITQIFETLLEFDDNEIDVGPGLARSWEPSADGLSWTFHLRPDVRFHDGTPFNAEAVCANFERWYHFRGVQQSFAVSLSWRDVFGGFATRDDPTAPADSLYRSCEATADDEAVVHLTRRSGRFLPSMAAWPFSIASPDALRRYEADKVSGTPSGPKFEGTFGTEHPVGTGPFKLEQLVPNERTVLVRNDDYWGEKAKLSRVLFRPIPDPAARRQALESGEVHGYDPADPGHLEGLRRAGFKVLEREPVNVGFIALNQSYPPLDNLKVRQAIAHALDREAVVRAKYAPGTLLAEQFQPPIVPGHAEDVRRYPHDPDLAEKLLNESGVTEPTLEFWYPTGRATSDLPDPEGIFEAFRSDLERVGFTVVPKPMAQPQYFQTVITGGAAMYFISLSSLPDPDFFLGTFFKDKAPPWGFDDPALFRSVNEANVEPEPARRVARYEEINRRVMELLPGVPLVHVKSALVLSERVEGYTSPVTGGDDLSTVTLR